ncbi:hypothetical protein BBU64B_F0036, partial (plasmid) [Borreliella burgdorferi 64b]
MLAASLSPASAPAFPNNFPAFLLFSPVAATAFSFSLPPAASTISFIPLAIPFTLALSATWLLQLIKTKKVVNKIA